MFRTPAGTLRLRQLSDGKYRPPGGAPGTVHVPSRTCAEEGVMKWARSRGYFAEAQDQGSKRLLVLRRYGV